MTSSSTTNVPKSGTVLPLSWKSLIVYHSNEHGDAHILSPIGFQRRSIEGASKLRTLMSDGGSIIDGIRGRKGTSYCWGIEIS